jgi:hypothetical protein
MSKAGEMLWSWFVAQHPTRLVPLAEREDNFASPIRPDMNLILYENALFDF